uniref:Vomeronasal type-1 receptor n=1 Tax=Piliocolobus tephrosceles TaxID=591936 RepID=A0A8C9GWZ2_9PRIM
LRIFLAFLLRHSLCVYFPRKMNKNKKLSSFIAIRNAAFSEVGIGISANAMLLLFHILTCLLKHRIRPTDLIIGHVALIHIILLLPTGFIATDIFGSQDSGDDIKHKSVMYMYRLMRGLSISTTCLLSVLPAITCNPRSSCLAMFKDSHITSHIAFSSCGSSTYPLGEASESPLFPSKMLPQIALHLSLSCSVWPLSCFLGQTIFILMTFQDVSLAGLMALSSGYMVILLSRHNRQSQHFHSTNLSPKAPPEKMATQTILLLVSYFVIVCIVDCVVTSSSGLMLVDNGCATISPSVLLKDNKSLIIQ